MTIHRAFWHRWFKTMWFKGSVAYELQVGPLVFQWSHRKRDYGLAGRVYVWHDWYWSTKRAAYLRHALWGTSLPEYH